MMRVNFDPPMHIFVKENQSKQYMVLAGANNSGKSLLLKHLVEYLGVTTYLVGAERNYHISELNSSGIPALDIHQFRHNYQVQLKSNLNSDSNFINLELILRALDNDSRDALFNLCGELLGNKFSIKSIDEKNIFSAKYVDMDGQNLTTASTGTRLLIALMGICFLKIGIQTLLIDEPELGLSPKLQTVLAKYLKSTEYRKNYFPHLLHVVVATHSHHFLDAQDLSNNFIVTKEENRISLEQVSSINDFHRLQFNLLGNTFESMFLPSAIVIVEGKTDYKFIDKVLQIHLKDKRVTVTEAGDDSQTNKIVHVLKQTLGDLFKSPFRNRLFVVLDKVHSQNLYQKLKAQGVAESNIIIWSKNGIEHLYPREIMMEIFACSAQQVEDLSMVGDIIEINGIRKTKNELAEEVVSLIHEGTHLAEEFTSKLIDKLREVVE